MNGKGQQVKKIEQPIDNCIFRNRLSLNQNDIMKIVLEIIF